MSKYSLEFAARCIQDSKALLITAGAGMGVDSGLPVFRGDQDLWDHYPFFKQTGMRFTDAANPAFFESQPAKFWYFYGHRFNLYRNTQPHEGYSILLSLVKKLDINHFVFTSNVDNHFHRGGFDPERIAECHGSIFHFQCNKCWVIFDAPTGDLTIDQTSSEAEIPRCPRCGAMVRPNILMFNDLDWISDRTQTQIDRFQQWLNANKGVPLTILEAGAGENVATIRRISEDVLCRLSGERTNLIRINPREQDLHRGWYRD